MKPASYPPCQALFGLILILSCATKPSENLARRGLPAEERHGFIIQEGLRTPLQIRQAFEAGYVVPGMEREFVFQLYGRPDRGFETGRVWEYLDERRRLITGLTFDGEKVDSIYGDPNGGSPPRTARTGE